MRKTEIKVHIKGNTLYNKLDLVFDAPTQYFKGFIDNGLGGCWIWLNAHYGLLVKKWAPKRLAPSQVLGDSQRDSETWDGGNGGDL